MKFYIHIKTAVTLIAVIMSANSMAFAQLMVNGKNPNGETYDYFFDYPYSGCKVLDSTLLRVNYISDFAVDTAAGTRIKEKSTLEIGREICKFYHFQNFTADSLLKAGYNLQIVSDILFEEIAYPLSFHEAVFTNFPEGRTTCTGRVATQYFLYEEEMPDIAWNIGDSIKTILGRTCYKATCNFRGRDYTAWFAPDIPVMSGPWKLTGLPGLILEAYDSRKEYTFKACGIYPTRCSIDLPDKMYLKTRKANYTKAKKLLLTNYKQAYSLYLTNTRWEVYEDGNNSPSVRMKYDFIEKE